ncbi:tetratricopeptide repeat protein [candidate division WOR-3 bacterium]|nr:tetratricopeptide repeat protein [candidate division WOR-3 bacterium]
MGNEKRKQSKLEKIKIFKISCISQGKGFSPELDSGLRLGFNKIMVNSTSSVLRLKIVGFICIMLAASCAYFNTFYNAQSYYREGMKRVTNDTLKVDSEYFDKTIEKATAVIVKYPDSRYIDDALLMMGSSYYYKGDYSRALEKLDFLILNYPESKFYDDALYYKGLAYYKQRKLAQATIALKEALLSKQYRVRAMVVLCYVYYQDANYASLTEIAKDLQKESLNLKERRWVLRLLGEAQFNQESYGAALELFNELLSLTRVKEAQQVLKLKIAEIYLEMEEYEECQGFLEGERDPEFKNLLADLYVELGDIEKAKETYFEVAVSGMSNFAAQAFYKLAELYRDADSLEAAIAYYDSSVNRASMNEYGLKSKKMADILRRIDVLVKETENIDRAQFLLAEIYFVDFNEPERAVIEYQKVYTDFPGSEWAPKALYAQLWITSNVFKDDSLASLFASDLRIKYPGSEYAISAMNFLGESNIKPGVRK